MWFNLTLWQPLGSVFLPGRNRRYNLNRWNHKIHCKCLLIKSRVRIMYEGEWLLPFNRMILFSIISKIFRVILPTYWRLYMVFFFFFSSVILIAHCNRISGIYADREELGKFLQLMLQSVLCKWCCWDRFYFKYEWNNKSWLFQREALF